MKKSKKILKYCANFDELVKEASPPPIPHPIRPPLVVPTAHPMGIGSKIKQYFAPKVKNPFHAGRVGDTPHFSTLLGEIKRITFPSLNLEGGQFFTKFNQVAVMGEQNGIKFDKNPNSPTYRQITHVDPNRMPPELLNEYRKPETQKILRQEIQEYNQSIRQSAKRFGELEGRGFKTDFSPIGRQTWAVKNRAAIGASVLAGIASLYFAFSSKAPSTTNIKKKEIIDNALENLQVSEIPNIDSTIAKIESLNSKLEAISERSPKLSNKLMPFIAQGEQIILSLNNLAPESMDVDNISEISAYAKTVSLSMNTINLYSKSLQKLYNIMAKSNKQNLATLIQEIQYSLIEYSNLSSQYRTQKTL